MPVASDRYQQILEDAKREVATWPAWKRQQEIRRDPRTPKRSPYDLGSVDSIQDIKAALSARLPRGMNPYTGEPGPR